MKMKEVISKDLRLPFAFIRGSVNERNKKAQAMYKLFHKELNNYSNGKICTVDSLKKALDKTLSPFNINYETVNNKNEKGILASLAIKRNAEYIKDTVLMKASRYQFAFRTNKKNEIPAKYSILHETSHFLDKLFHPKTILFRLPKDISTNKSWILDKREELRNLLFCNLNEKVLSKKEIKKSCIEMLEKIPLEERVNIIQAFRYSLKTEIRAYDNEMKAILKDGINLSNITTVVRLKRFLIKNCKFNYKLDLLNKLLKETIQQERISNQKRNYK